MNSSQTDLSIFRKFEFKLSPVGVKFLPNKPQGIRQLEKVLDFCEMLKEAQNTEPFYAAKEQFSCVGPLILGMTDSDPIFESGQVGPKLGVFKDARANRRVYQEVPRLAKGIIKCVAFSSLARLSFNPDVLIITASVVQAELLLRAYSYSTGKMWTAKGTTVIGCAWLYIYPYVSGELNLTVTGFGHGMKIRRLFPEGMILISIPWDLIPGITENLKEMEWVPHSYTITPEEHKQKMKRIAGELKQELLD